MNKIDSAIEIMQSLDTELNDEIKEKDLEIVKLKTEVNSLIKTLIVLSKGAVRSLEGVSPYEIEVVELVHSFFSMKGDHRTSYCKQEVHKDDFKWKVENHDLTCPECIEVFKKTYRCSKGCKLKCCEGKCQCEICVDHTKDKTEEEVNE